VTPSPAAPTRGRVTEPERSNGVGGYGPLPATADAALCGRYSMRQWPSGDRSPSYPSTPHPLPTQELPLPQQDHLLPATHPTPEERHTVSTTTLHAAVDTATTTATLRVAGVLTSLDGCGILTLATADSLLADLAAAEEHSDDDKARAQVAMNAGLRAHTLLCLVKACLRALADPDDNSQLDQALIDAVIAADPVVTASVSKALRDSITPGDAALHFALIGELRRAQQAAADTTQVPDTIPDDWTDGGLQ